MLPPAEIQKGITQAIQEYAGVSMDDAVLYIRRRLGFQQASAQLREVIIRNSKELIETSQIEESDNKMTVSH